MARHYCYTDAVTQAVVCQTSPTIDVDLPNDRRSTSPTIGR
eukprot:SAG25_NODE_438_length_8018_cov_7.819800_5_plen_41_part_00